MVLVTFVNPYEGGLLGLLLGIFRLPARLLGLVLLVASFFLAGLRKLLLCRFYFFAVWHNEDSDAPGFCKLHRRVPSDWDMAIHRTVDHQEIREWVEKHRAYPAIVAGSENDRADGDLTLSFADPDPHAIHISWEEFFAMFETQALRFRYQDPGDTGETPEWAFSFESRDTATDASDETVLPEDIEDIDTNLFPSAPAVDHPSPDLREDLEAGEEL